MASGGRSATGAVFTSSDNASVYFPTTEGLWAESITCNKVKFPFLIILGNRILSCLVCGLSFCSPVLEHQVYYQK